MSFRYCLNFFFSSKPNLSCPWDKDKPNISVELYNLTFFVSLVDRAEILTLLLPLWPAG